MWRPKPPGSWLHCRSFEPSIDCIDRDLSPVLRRGRLNETMLTDSEFHARADRVLATIEATLDRWLQDDEIDIDSQRTGGLLELVFPGGSKDRKSTRLNSSH